MSSCLVKWQRCKACTVAASPVGSSPQKDKSFSACKALPPSPHPSQNTPPPPPSPPPFPTAPLALTPIWWDKYLLYFTELYYGHLCRQSCTLLSRMKLRPQENVAVVYNRASLMSCCPCSNVALGAESMHRLGICTVGVDSVCSVVVTGQQSSTYLQQSPQWLDIDTRCFVCGVT